MTPQQKVMRTQQAILNDQFRVSGLGVMLTNGVQSVEDLPGLYQAIQEFDDFNENNDPWNEHDFGRLDWHGDRIFWKIDYYNATLDEWEHPLSGGCKRVMTIMLSEEY